MSKLIKLPTYEWVCGCNGVRDLASKTGMCTWHCRMCEEYVQLPMISFSKTEKPFKSGIKTQTRRLGWSTLSGDTYMMGVSKRMGLRKGESPERWGAIYVTNACYERLDDITQKDVIAEGFPEWTPEQFVTFFCDEMRCAPREQVRKIEFVKI